MFMKKYTFHGLLIDMKKCNINAKFKKNPNAKPNYFTGTVIAKDISTVIKPKEEKIYHVSFQNGARTKIHYHDAGQVLIVTNGIGSLVLYKKLSNGKKKFKISIQQSISLKKDDLVYIPKNILHTHGAINKKRKFSHIAINSYPQRNIEPKTIWYESDFKKNVTDRLK